MNRILLLAALACAGIHAAHAQGTISNGDVAFERGATPWDASPEAGLTGVSQALASDHLFETGWAFRVLGDTQEFFLPTPDSQLYGISVSEHVWNDVAARGLFSATESSFVIDFDGPGGDAPGGQVEMALTIANISANPLTIDLFHMIDLNIGGNASMDSAELLAPLTTPTIRITDGAQEGFYMGEDADAFIVRPFAPDGVGTLLNDGDIDNFDDGVLPVSDFDFTGGMQWANRTLQPGERLTVRVRFSVNQPVLGPDLSIAIDDAPDPVALDTPLDYTVTVANTLAHPAPNVSVNFGALPAGVVAIETTGCANDPAGFPECELGLIGLGDQKQFMLRVLPGVGTPAVIETQVTVGSPDILDPFPENNTTKTATTTLWTDLLISKTNNMNGVAVDIDGWLWSLTLQNAGDATADATFLAGDTLLLDQLPDTNVAYGAPMVAAKGLVTGTAQCSLAGFDLTCIATNAMTIGPGGSIAVSIPALPGLGEDVFLNPRPAGTCAADPQDVVFEVSENNNVCSDSVQTIDFMLFSDGFEQ